MFTKTLTLVAATLLAAHHAVAARTIIDSNDEPSPNSLETQRKNETAMDLPHGPKVRKMAYCDMKPNPTNLTTYPYGMFKLVQPSPIDDVHIDGWMRQMPSPASEHGFVINYRYYPGGQEDCHKTTVPHWDQ